MLGIKYAAHAESLSMWNRKLFIKVVSVVVLSGCYGPPLVSLPNVTEASRVEVVFIRPSAFNAAGVPIAVGFDKGTIVVLRNAEYAVVVLPADKYNFFVQAKTTPLHGLPPEMTYLELQIAHGERTCIMAVADQQNAWRAAVPFLMMVMGPRFTLERIPCPAQSDFALYRRVSLDSPTP